VEARRADGIVFPLELTITAIPEGRDFSFSAFARDITRRKQDDRERARLLADAERARTQAETASRVKDEFLSMLSHELRTPLTAIVGWTYLLRGGRLDEATALRGLDAIERNAAAQAQVISDILDLSRMVGAKFRLNVRPLQLAPIAAAAIEPLMPAATAKSLTVRAVLDPSAGLVVGDPDRLRQIVGNLAGNAVKFTPRGGRVTVRVERAPPAAVRLVVEDTGEGIPPISCPTSSSASARATPRTRAATAASAWGWRWSAISWSCTAARSKRAAKGRGAAPSSPSSCPSSIPPSFLRPRPHPSPAPSRRRASWRTRRTSAACASWSWTTARTCARS